MAWVDSWQEVIEVDNHQGVSWASWMVTINDIKWIDPKIVSIEAIQLFQDKNGLKLVFFTLRETFLMS